MVVSKEVFVDLGEKYDKVNKLLEASKHDPPNEPYKSKYLAKQRLLEMKVILEALGSHQFLDPAESMKVRAILAAVYLHLGSILIDTEELSTGEKYLQQCYTANENNFNTSEMVMIGQTLFNQLGIFFAQGDAEKSKSFLEKSETLYLEFKKTGAIPIDVRQLFSCIVEKQCEETISIAKNNFEKNYTFTLYYLAQIYGTLKDTSKSAVYCHITLQRQLDSGEHDPIDWALNSATLSQFFMEKNCFKQARHHLSASSYILDGYEEKLNSIVERDEYFDAKMEVFRHRSADVARCWAKYGLLLLSQSKERLMERAEDMEEYSIIDRSHVNEFQNLKFTSIDTTKYEQQVTDDFVLTIEDARLVFINIQMWLRKAESYYTLELLASDHIEIVQDQSQMYLNLLFFEDNMENQAKLHKRRIVLLENIIKKVNPQYYLRYCRQIWFDLGQTYSDILDIKYDKLRELNDRPCPHLLTKINHLTERSISYFTCFIDSLKEDATKEYPHKISDDVEKAFLQACFRLGVLHTKYITLDKEKQLTNVQNSYNAYLKITDYCKSHNKATELIPGEHNISKEIITLLPAKIAKLKQELL